MWRRWCYVSPNCRTSCSNIAVLGGQICRPVLPVGGIAVLDVNAGRVARAVLGGVVVVLLRVFGSSSGGIVLSGGMGHCTRITC